MIDLCHLLCKQFFIAVYLSIICMNLISFHFEVYLLFWFINDKPNIFVFVWHISDVVLKLEFVVIRVGKITCE